MGKNGVANVTECDNFKGIFLLFFGMKTLEELKVENYNAWFHIP